MPPSVEILIVIITRFLPYFSIGSKVNITTDYIIVQRHNRRHPGQASLCKTTAGITNSMSLVADVDHSDYINILLYKIVLNSLSFQGLLNTVYYLPTCRSHAIFLKWLHLLTRNLNPTHARIISFHEELKGRSAGSRKRSITQSHPFPNRII